MAQRLLPGVTRTGPNVWRWGCWEIEAVERVFGGYFWMIMDVQSQISDEQAHQRTIISMDGLANLKWILRGLARLGPDPIVTTQEAV